MCGDEDLIDYSPEDDWEDDAWDLMDHLLGTSFATETEIPTGGRLAREDFLYQLKPQASSPRVPWGRAYGPSSGPSGEAGAISPVLPCNQPAPAARQVHRRFAASVYVP